MAEARGPGPLPIVWQGPRAVVVDKPAGWLSVPSRLGEDDARPCVGTTLEEQLGTRLFPVHRLDLEVSGLLLFAKDADAHRRLCQGFEAHTIEKTYRAIGEGPPPAELLGGVEVSWTTTLLRGKRRAYVHPAGKPSRTDVRLLGTRDGRPVFELKPRTGRAHQLRVELARHGCPIRGDVLYGARPQDEAAIALRALVLDFSAFGDAARLGIPSRIALPQGEYAPRELAPSEAAAS